MKITPISNEPSVAVAVVADEENVIPTKNCFDDADDEDLTSSSSRTWSKCLIAGAVAFLTALAVAIALPLIHNTRKTEYAALQMITFDMNNNQSGSNETRLYESIISIGRHGICSINEAGSSITYVPDEGFFGIDSCTFIVVVCSDVTGVCESPTEETITFSVKDPDALITSSPDVMVLVSQEITETATSVARMMSSTITTSSSITPAQTTAAATTSSPDEGGATFDATTTSFVPGTIAANACSECSVTKYNNNFCGQLGIQTIMDPCESQTECEELGMQCTTCSSVEGVDEDDVGNGAYICVEKERDDKTEDDTTTITTTTITASTTGADDTTSTITTTTTADDTTTTTATTTAESSFNECSITNDERHFRGQLGIYTFIDACESQTECEERGLQCIVCSSVEGFDGDVGTGAYICVEEELGDKAADNTTTTSTIAATTTAADDTTTTTTEVSLGGIESLMGTEWKAEEIRWLIPTSEELKDTTEEDRNPITLVFKSDTRVSGTCGNNRCSSGISLKGDQLRFGKFRRTKMAASEQEQNYVFLLEETAFFYDVWEHGNGSKELDLYEIVVDDKVEKRGRKMATYFQMEIV